MDVTGAYLLDCLDLLNKIKTPVMNSLFYLLSSLLVLFCNYSHGQELNFTITTAHPYLDAPVFATLQNVDFNSGNNYQLVEIINGEKSSPINFQIEKGYTNRIWWILTGKTAKNKERKFKLIPIKESSEKKDLTLRFKKNDKHLTIFKDNTPVLQYNHALTPPPEGESKLYTRSGYIHPIFTPAGFTLTTIHPEDHLHHMGLWNPWTKTEFEGRALDFWNLNKGQGTIQFANFISHYAGSVFTGFKSLHEHIDLTAPTYKGKKVVLNEVWDVRVYKPGEDYTIIDFTSHLNCNSESPFILKEYRYGGFGFRANQYWTNQNSQVVTSAGKTREDADASKARWAIISGETPKGGNAGIIFMSHPANYQHPEPVRVWPPDANGGRGDVFFNFSPTRHSDWFLQPDKVYTLQYRIVVFDGAMDASRAEQYWQNFANQLVVEVE